MSLSAEEPKRATPWWANDDARKELLETAKQIWDDETSDINGIYAYSLNFLRNNFKKLKSLKNVSRYVTLSLDSHLNCNRYSCLMPAFLSSSSPP